MYGMYGMGWNGMEWNGYGGKCVDKIGFCQGDDDQQVGVAFWQCNPSIALRCTHH